MLNALKEITLYDVLGYLFPGFIFLVALIVLFWAVFSPTTALLPLFQNADDIGEWSLVVIAAYILGHLVQGIGNAAFRRLPSTRSLVFSRSETAAAGIHRLPEPLVSKARSRLAARLEVREEDIDDSLLYQLCDEFVMQSGIKEIISNREIYIYREGFYRGMTVSLALLFLSLMVVMGITLNPAASLKLSDDLPPANLAMLLPLNSLLVIGTWLSFQRYRRFGGYRVRQALLGFLVMGKEDPKEDSSRASPE